MPLFLCDVLLIVPASTSHLLSDTASVEQAQLDGCHCCSWDVPHKLRDKVLGKSCDILDSVLLIDTFFVLFRSCLG